MFIWVIAVSVAIAVLRGGNFRSIPDFKGLWVPPLAMASQLAALIAPGSVLGVVLISSSYALLVWFTALNLSHTGLRLVLLGILLNFLVIGANGGRMPALPAAAERAGVDMTTVMAGRGHKHVVMTEQTRLAFLGDVIPLVTPINRIISIGDVFVMAGSFLLVQEIMGRPLTFSQPGERHITSSFRERR